ncbi:MAG: DUF402 domain-containing protein [Erysipelotrichaceae bacterium]|nr:DUF402 domain-containing protein [Erysipelotrichaceae bacterium]MDY5251665.1 DUF402 domain-containing protein [Erysipelotrichaceae bacterium]
MLPAKYTHVYIQSYKHNGKLHRTWSKGFVIEANDDEMIIVTNKTWVIEADGRRWITREPAICFFYPDKWYNIIAMIRKNGTYYYCNMASPSIYDGEAVKNIDYDLDVKLFPDGYYEVLDENEYVEHSEMMGYSVDLKMVVEKQLKELISKIERKEAPFDQNTIKKYYREYQKHIKNG